MYVSVATCVLCEVLTATAKELSVCYLFQPNSNRYYGSEGYQQPPNTTSPFIAGRASTLPLNQRPTEHGTSYITTPPPTIGRHLNTTQDKV